MVAALDIDPNYVGDWRAIGQRLLAEYPEIETSRQGTAAIVKRICTLLADPSIETLYIEMDDWKKFQEAERKYSAIGLRKGDKGMTPNGLPPLVPTIIPKIAMERHTRESR